MPLRRSGPARRAHGFGGATEPGVGADAPFGHPAAAIPIGAGPRSKYTAAPQPAAGSCHYQYENGEPLPDLACTPGAIRGRPPLGPYINAECALDDCRQCPVKSAGTCTDARRVSFLSRDLYDIQSESQAEQRTQEWLSRCGSPSRAISEFVNGHGMRQCRYWLR